MNDHITVIYFLVEGQEIKFSPQASTLLCAKFRPLLGGGGQQRRLTPNKPLHVLVGLGLGRHILGCPRFWHRPYRGCVLVQGHHDAHAEVGQGRLEASCSARRFRELSVSVSFGRSSVEHHHIITSSPTTHAVIIINHHHASCIIKPRDNITYIL